MIKLSDDDDYDFYKDNSSLDSSINHLSESSAVARSSAPEPPAKTTESDKADTKPDE